MNMEYKASTLINKSPEYVFSLLSALDRLNEWMPTSPAYLGTDLTSDLPVREGSTYICRSPQGNRAGVIETFDPSNRIVFKEIFNKFSATITYKFSSEEGGTNLERHVVIKGPALMMILLKTRKGKFEAGNKIVLQDIKTEAEKR